MSCRHPAFGRIYTAPVQLRLSPQGLTMNYNYVETFIKEIKVIAEDYQAKQKEEDFRKDAELAIFRETSTPLAERLKKLIASIPEEEINVPRSLEWYRTRLRGIEGRGAHAGQVGDSLRALGFQRNRAWSSTENGFRALWIPPSNLKQKLTK